MNKKWKVLTGAVLAASLVIAPLVVSTSALADEVTPVTTEEVAVEAAPEVVAEPVAVPEEGPAEQPAAPAGEVAVTVDIQPVAEPVAKAAAPAPVAPAAVAPATQTSDPVKCAETGEGWSEKVDTSGDPATVTVTADSGFLIDAYCVKASTIMKIVPVNPPASEVIIDHPDVDSVSHYQYHQIPIPDEPKTTSLNTPVIKDKCGTADDHYGLPEAPEGVTITRDGKDLIATLAEGYVVTLVPEGWVADGEGVYRYAFNAEQFTDVPCEQGPSCTTVDNAVTLVGDGVLTVTGGWDTDSIAVPFSGTLADIGTVLDIQATPLQYVGLHIDTDQGTITFEEEPSYGGNLWSESAWDGVAAGMGYAAFGSIEEFIAQNGDVVVTGIRLLYTHPEASSTTVESFTIGCTVYTFEPVREYPVPALFNAPPAPADCDSAAVYDASVFGTPFIDDGDYKVYEFENVYVEVYTDVEGEVFLRVTAKEGFTLSGLSEAWTVSEDMTIATRTIDLPPATGVYQSTDPAAECYLAPPPPPVDVQPAPPTFVDNCGTANDTWVVPGNTDTFRYVVVKEGNTVTITAELRAEGAVWADGITTEWSKTFTNEACPSGVTPPPTPGTPPTPGLAVTGGGDVSPLVPLAGGLASVLGLAMVALSIIRRRVQA